MIIGTSVAYAVCTSLGRSMDLKTAGVALVASILADADEDSSKINQMIPFHYKKLIYAILAGTLFYYAYKNKEYSYIIPAVVALLIYISGHRGFTHSITAAVIFALPLIKYNTMFIAFLTAYIMHLVCDMVNTKGIPILWPVPIRVKYPVTFTEEGIVGQLIELVCVLGCLTYILKKFII